MNEPEVKVLMLKGNDGSKIYYSSVQVSANSKNLSMSDLTPKADSANPPEIGASIVTPNGDVFAIARLNLAGSTATYDVGNRLTSIRGPQGFSVLMYDGDIPGNGAPGETATADLSKIKPNGVAKVGDIVFDNYQNAQGDVELGYWRIDSISSNSANVVGISGGFTIPRGARGEIGPQGERGPQGLPGSISNTKIAPSMLTSDLWLSAYPTVDLVDNLTWYNNTFINEHADFFNLLGGMEDGHEYTSSTGGSDIGSSMFVPVTKTTYTLSFEAKSTVNGDKIRSYFYDSDSSKNCVLTSNGIVCKADGNTVTTLTENYVRYSITYTVNPIYRRPLNVIAARPGTDEVGVVQGTIAVKNVRLASGADPADSMWGVSDRKMAYLDVQQGETYYARDLSNDTGLNAPMVVTDDNLNVVSSIPARKDASYHIEIPAGGTKLFLNSKIGMHPMLFSQTTFNENFSTLVAIDTLWQVVMAGKTPNHTTEVSLEHVDKSQYSSKNAYWGQSGLLFESDGTATYNVAYACKPIKVMPYESYGVSGYNVNKANLVTIIDFRGHVLKSIPGNDSTGWVGFTTFTIPNTGAYILVNDNRQDGHSTDLQKVKDWK